MKNNIKYNRVEKEFYDKAFIWSNTLLFKPSTAIKFIKRCKELNIEILGIDAFKIKGDKIQSLSEYSIDYSNIQNQNIKDRWKNAQKFIREKTNLDLIFEVVCD